MRMCGWSGNREEKLLWLPVEGADYPLLQRMERLGWLKGETNPRPGRARKDYHLTPKRQKVFEKWREQVCELYDEVVRGADKEESR